MDANIIKDILDLKEGNGYNIMQFLIRKKEDGDISIVFEGDSNFLEIIEDNLHELMMLNMKLYMVYKDEIDKDLEEFESVQLVSLGVIADDKGNAIRLHLPYTNIYKNGADELIELATEVNGELDKKLNSILDKFVDIEENLKYFQLMFKRANGEYRYYDFCRMSDRPIKQQKVEINELLNLDFEEKLISQLTQMGYDLNNIVEDKIVIGFSTDKKDIYGLKFAPIPNS